MAEVQTEMAEATSDPAAFTALMEETLEEVFFAKALVNPEVFNEELKEETEAVAAAMEVAPVVISDAPVVVEEPIENVTPEEEQEEEEGEGEGEGEEEENIDGLGGGDAVGSPMRVTISLGAAVAAIAVLQF